MPLKDHLPIIGARSSASPLSTSRGRAARGANAIQPFGRSGNQNANFKGQVSGAMWKLAAKSIPIGFTLASIINLARDFIAAIFDKQYSDKANSNSVQKAAFNARYWAHLFAEVPGALLVTLQAAVLFTMPTWASTIVCPILKLVHDWVRARLGVNTRRAAYLDFEDGSSKKADEDEEKAAPKESNGNNNENPYDKNQSLQPSNEGNQTLPPPANPNNADTGQDDKNKTGQNGQNTGQSGDQVPNSYSGRQPITYPNGTNGIAPTGGWFGNRGLTDAPQPPVYVVVNNSPITRNG